MREGWQRRADFTAPGLHSSACVWMHARSSLDSALQWRLVVLANELAIFRDANDEVGSRTTRRLSVSA